MAEGQNDLDLAQTEWTRFDVICDGSHIQNFVNGTLVNEAFEVTPSAGRIQLQSEMAEIYFRRWELYPIGKAPKPGQAAQ